MEWALTLVSVACLTTGSVVSVPTAVPSYNDTDCLKTYKGSDYKGNVSVTIDGVPCVAWTTKSYLMYRDHHFPDASIEEAGNRCRNARNLMETVWCHTASFGWGICDVPLCTEPFTRPPTSSARPQECLLSADGLKYIGQISVTRNNRTCQEWRRQVPHEHSHWYERYNFPDRTVRDAVNYCRNPDKKEEGPWCYTTHPYVEWEFCDIPLCYPHLTTKPPAKLECLVASHGNNYMGHRSFTRSNRTCQRWLSLTPHSHDYFLDDEDFADVSVSKAKNYCRNPDGLKDGPWCFTMDPAVRWEYCDIPLCKDRTKTAHPPAKSCLSQGSLAGLVIGLLLVGVLLGLVIVVTVVKARGGSIGNMGTTLMSMTNPGYVKDV